MNNTVLAEKLFVGPAMVVDDRIDSPTSNMRPIVSQIRAANIPVFQYTALPEIEQVRHWRGFSLIVLDWELMPLPPESSTTSESGASDAPPMGIAIPEGLGEAVTSDVANFVQHLYAQLYCPIFIFSDQATDLIWGQLEDGTGIPRQQLEARVLVRSKNDVRELLFEELGAWLRAHPAIYAVRSWEEGYEEAKKQLFEDLQTSSLDWPRIMWSASTIDQSNEHFELTETISRNILHRFAPLSFDETILGEPLTPAEVDLAALRRVVHRQAVIEGSSLHADVLMPGDFFYGNTVDGIPETIDICLTPACDLVARGVDAANVEMVIVTAYRVSDLEQKKPQARRNLLERETTTSQILHVLTASARPYKVSFSNWHKTTWGEIGERRSGRLLDP